MDSSDLKVMFVVDAIQGRNGVGTYFQDLVGHLDGRLSQVELVAPSLAKPHCCQGAALPMPGDPTQKLFVPRMRELARLIVQMKPDVIVVPGPGLFSLCGFWMAAKLGIPVCVTHQTDYRGLVNLYWRGAFARIARWVVRSLDVIMFRGAASVATISASLQSELRQQAGSVPRLVGTPLCPDFIQAAVSPPSGQVSKALYVGRLAAEKNIEHFLELVRQRPDLSFSIAGDGPLRARVIEAAQRHANLVFHGWCSRQRVRELVDEHDLLILPSRVEAFGTVALEAMARQRLVMVTPECGISQWQALSQALVVLHQDERLEQGVARLQAMESGRRVRLALAARQAALTVNEQSLRQWEHMLVFTATQASRLPPPGHSPAFAVLRRLASVQAG